MSDYKKLVIGPPDAISKLSDLFKTLKAGIDVILNVSKTSVEFAKLQTSAANLALMALVASLDAIILEIEKLKGGTFSGITAHPYHYKVKAGYDRNTDTMTLTAISALEQVQEAFDDEGDLLAPDKFNNYGGIVVVGAVPDITQFFEILESVGKFFNQQELIDLGKQIKGRFKEGYTQKITADGQTDTYEIDLDSPVTPKSLKVYYNTLEVGKDNGVGDITGELFKSSYIEYNKKVLLNFIIPPVKGAKIKLVYDVADVVKLSEGLDFFGVSMAQLFPAYVALLNKVQFFVEGVKSGIISASNSLDDMLEFIEKKLAEAEEIAQDIKDFMDQFIFELSEAGIYYKTFSGQKADDIKEELTKGTPASWKTSKYTLVLGIFGGAESVELIFELLSLD